MHCCIRTENDSKYPLRVEDPLEGARRIEKFVFGNPPEDKPAILVGLTHLLEEDDHRPGFSLVMGGMTITSRNPSWPTKPQSSRPSQTPGRSALIGSRCSQMISCSSSFR
jgi:hypothetical protein